MPTTMCYSVGDTGPDRKTGTPTVTVSGTTATFSAAQTGNIGIGDVIDYDADNKKAYIVAKVSQTEWTVRSATAGTPTAASAVTVNSIKRVFADLRAAVHAGSTGGSGMSALIGITQEDATPLSCVSNDLVIKICCYKDRTDTSSGSIDARAITGDATRYLWVGTPHDEATECNNSQYPDGTQGSGYLITRQLQPRSGSFQIYEGLEIDGSVNSLVDGFVDTTSNDCQWISCRARGCSSRGFEGHSGGQWRNCISHGNDRGFVKGSGGTGSARGCLAYGNTSHGFDGSTVNAYGCMSLNNGGSGWISSGGSSNKNVSSDATAPGATNLQGKTDYTSYFTAPASGDFTLLDTTANDGVFGATGLLADGPSADANVIAYDAKRFSRAGESTIDVGPLEYESGGGPPPDPTPESDEVNAVAGALRGSLRGVA